MARADEGAVRLLIELSGEQPDLARAEALAAIEASGQPHKLLVAEERLLAVESDVDPAWLGRRLGLANCVDELLGWGSLEDAMSAAKSIDLADRTFRVRVNSLKGCHNKVEIERRIGDLVKGPVDLTNPNVEIRLVEGEQHYLGRRLAAVDRRAFEQRKVTERSFFFPISLHPRLARVLVNLSRVPDDGTLLDPFCGTGGVLLEAGLVGARLVGGDVREDMVAGCRKILSEFDLAANLRAGDVAEVAGHFEGVDAVAMDPPYGRATTTMGEALPSLYRRAFASAARAVKPGGFIAATLPSTVAIPDAEGLERVESYSFRVHRSLTRTFLVTRRLT
jgi:tRNA (guanine10-N2)-dimethyltransferase